MPSLDLGAEDEFYTSESENEGTDEEI